MSGAVCGTRWGGRHNLFESKVGSSVDIAAPPLLGDNHPAAKCHGFVEAAPMSSMVASWLLDFTSASRPGPGMRGMRSIHLIHVLLARAMKISWLKRVLAPLPMLSARLDLTTRGPYVDVLQ
jgi:hypothetical protein